MSESILGGFIALFLSFAVLGFIVYAVSGAKKARDFVISRKENKKWMNLR